MRKRSLYRVSKRAVELTHLVLKTHASILIICLEFCF
jgi:hypothetical protein